MPRGKLIVIEGTECSGKETQVKKAIEYFAGKGIKIYNYSFPNYDSPTGKIVGGPYLGKHYICDGWFPEGAVNVDPLVACAYYAADRRYNIGIINEHLENGDIVLLDRYVESNMAHQGGKLKTPEERAIMYEKLDKLEFGFMELPRPDFVIFLYMPYEYAAILKKNRAESPLQQENNKAHLELAEKAYLELTEKYNYIKVDCVKDDVIRTIDDISKEVVERLEEVIK
jgi:dTMP kinase